MPDYEFIPMELIPSGLIPIILAVLFIVSFVVLPFILLNKNKITHKDSFKDINSDINPDKQVFSSVRVQNSTVCFKRNGNISNVFVQITVKTSKKFRAKYVSLNFNNDEFLGVDFKEDIQEINMLVKKVDGEKITRDSIMGPKLSLVIVIALLQALSTGAGVILYAFSYSGLLEFYTPGYFKSYLMAALSLIVLGGSIALNLLALNFTKKGGK